MSVSLRFRKKVKNCGTINSESNDAIIEDRSIVAASTCDRSFLYDAHMSYFAWCYNDGNEMVIKRVVGWYINMFATKKGSAKYE